LYDNPFFLRLSLSRRALFSAAPIEQNNANEVEKEEEEEIDLSKFASKKSSGRVETFAAGDWVMYVHPVSCSITSQKRALTRRAQMMAFTVKSRVIAVDASSRFPLKLENDEVKYSVY
jgi:hypothetical protein